MSRIRLRNQLYWVVLLIVCAAAGCAAVNSDRHDDTAACEPPRLVQSTEELLEFLAQIEWTPVGGYSNRRPVVSQDVLVSGTMTLTPAQVPVPQSCLNRGDCRHEATLFVSSSLPGVECQGNETGGCDAMNLTDTRVRFRGILRDTHPSRWNFSPMLETLPACSAPCMDGEFRCPADDTCWSSFESYCRLCAGQTKEACACQSPEGNQPDGSDCRVWVSGDVIRSGTCQAGVCR